MINYIEKGIGLHDAIAKSGNWLREIDGVWHASDITIVQDIIDSYPLRLMHDEIVSVIDAHASDIRNKVTIGISAAEMASWPIKRAEAARFAETADPADAPILTAEAAARGIPLADIVTRVQANAVQLAMLEAAISGIAGRHKDAVRALDTFEAVLAYDWQAGWPVI